MKKTIIEVPDDCRECPCVVEARARIGSSERMFWLCRAFNAVLVMEVLKKTGKTVCVHLQSASGQKFLNELRQLLGRQRKEEEYLMGRREYRKRAET